MTRLDTQTGDTGPTSENPRLLSRWRYGFTIALRFAAPYVSVLIFWVGLESAWLAMLGYHAQVAFWLSRMPPSRSELRVSRTLALALPSLLAGPVVFLLLPRIASTGVGGWLGRFGLSGASLVVMVVYFALVHPPLEQVYWSRLRETTPLSHVLFAGYHMIVLASLLPMPWLAACFAVLVGASLMWQHLQSMSGGLLAPIASHALSDAGIVLAAFLLVLERGM